jgi:hypothetical protein
MIFGDKRMDEQTDNWFSMVLIYPHVLQVLVLVPQPVRPDDGVDEPLQVGVVGRLSQEAAAQVQEESL